jgi:hypothetical protein
MADARSKRIWGYLAVLGALALAAKFEALGADAKSASAEEFATASIHFEQNATDGDNEVVFEIKGGKDGLAELTIVAPNGRKVVAFSAPERITLGMRQFRFESPEPQDAASLKAAYPEGEYLFRGKTFSGATFAGKSTLSHRLPETTTIVSPAPNAHGLAVGKLHIAWRAVTGVSAYIVELKTDASNSSIAARLPASSTSFAVPDGFLATGMKYKLAVGTVSRDGNISFVESSFTTGR